MKVFNLIILLGLLSFFGCDKDPEASGTDLELFNMAKTTEGFVWYKNSDALLPKSELSGHSEAFLKTRFNVTAAAMLDANGKVQSEITFPEGSLLVKELYSSRTNLSKYAILYKKSDHKYADSNGWVWGYLNSDGTVAEPASNKGSACKSCHSQNGNIDYSLMNVAFP
jgi:hypothetical protein